jgi:hypothetical protein
VYRSGCARCDRRLNGAGDDGGGTPDVQACVRLCTTRSIAAAAVESGGAVVLSPVVQYEY